MRTSTRGAAVTVAACAVVAIASSPSHADDADAWIYTGWNMAGYCEFQPYGEHMIIKDRDADGHSIIAELQVDGYGTTYHWNSNGNGTTRDKDLSYAEGHHVVLRCLVGDWKGTPTGGIYWDSYDKTVEFAQTWT